MTEKEMMDYIITPILSRIDEVEEKLDAILKERERVRGGIEITRVIGSIVGGIIGAAIGFLIHYGTK